MKLVFPASYLSNQLSMTGLLLVLGLSGSPQLAADVGIVQGAALALLFSFSGNARNLILRTGEIAPVREIALVRLMLVLPLSVGMYYLGAVLGGVSWHLTSVLIARKIVEWLTEVHLSEAERNQDIGFAFRHLLVQSALLVMVMVWIATDTPGLLFVLVLWAITPLLISIRYFKCLLGSAAKRVPLSMMLPHLGSSAVIGIGFYVFRLAILLLAGRAIAGDLYTAFAIGGVLGSIFALGLGPTLVLHEQNSGRRQMPLWLQALLSLTGLSGLIIVWLLHFLPWAAIFAGKTMLFWQATGFSLIGGVAMVLAHRQRLRDLQHGTQDDVFAPDVLVNMLIVIMVPVSFFAFGLNGLAWLYLLNGFVSVILYWMADIGRARLVVGQQYEVQLRVVIAMLLVMPVFFTLGTGLFRSEEFLYDSGGVLNKLPLPLSAFACYAGIMLLGNFRRANLALATIFLFFVLMTLATVATAIGGSSEERAKLLLLLQYVVPTFGLSLGMMYEGQEGSEHLVAKSVLVVIAALMPVQLLASWAQGRMILTPNLYVFSIYQHLQYVPMVVAASFVISLFSLWKFSAWRTLILLLSPVFGYYIAASGAMIAAGLALTGCAAFVVYQLARGTDNDCRWTVWAMSGSVLGAGVLYNVWAIRSNSAWPAGMYGGKLGGTALPANVQDRLAIWSHYVRGIVSDPSTFLFGHISPPDRDLLASAHNYYLDIAYNFGAVATLVVIGLALFTIIGLNGYRRQVLASSSTTGLTLVVLFLVLPDSLVKVGLRQPYPGIYSFFLWGLLLARIDKLRLACNRGSRFAELVHD